MIAVYRLRAVPTQNSQKPETLVHWGLRVDRDMKEVFIEASKANNRTAAGEVRQFMRQRVEEFEAELADVRDGP